ncbi:hypothetical protein NDU88_005699 [Pleurodeles waltl]|uniref:Uncharacterized protein n=1 Tax=Pleurodeles waltl TaxID=8319 RepID=A0AAV7W8K4_PLEWA|nr:hypothetical protein NDU88_005699 [Pleurodeles waltl]
MTGRNRHQRLWGSRGSLRRTSWTAGGARLFRAGLAAHEVPSSCWVVLGECPWSSPHYCTPAAPVTWSWGLVAALLAHLHSTPYSSPLGGCVGPRAPEGVRASFCAGAGPSALPTCNGAFFGGLTAAPGLLGRRDLAPWIGLGPGCGLLTGLPGDGSWVTWPWGGCRVAAQDCRDWLYPAVSDRVGQTLGSVALPLLPAETAHHYSSGVSDCVVPSDLVDHSSPGDCYWHGTAHYSRRWLGRRS